MRLLKKLLSKIAEAVSVQLVCLSIAKTVRKLHSIASSKRLGGRVVLESVGLVAGEVGLFLDLGEIDVSNSIVTIEDTGDLLESGSLGLDVEVPDEDEFTEVPEGVEKHKVPVVGHVIPRKLVGLAVVC